MFTAVAFVTIVGVIGRDVGFEKGATARTSVTIAVVAVAVGTTPSGRGGGVVI